LRLGEAWDLRLCIEVLGRPSVVRMDAVVTTLHGKLRGTVTDGVYAFLGVPYAAPPFWRESVLSAAAGRIVGWRAGCHQVRSGAASGRSPCAGGGFCLGYRRDR
jgi:hypothetical protein